MTSNSPGTKKCLYPLLKQQNTIKSLKKLYESEQFLEKLNLLLHLEDIIDIKSFLSMLINLSEKKLYMQESLLPNKKIIWKTKLNLLNNSIQNTPLLKTLVQDSTLKEKDLSPFWNKSCLDLSKKLSLPIMTGLQELDLISFSLSVNTSIQNLQFSQIKKIKDTEKNLQRNSSLLLPSIHQNSMECESMIYSRKIRFYPTSEQKKHFNKFFGASRYLYNKTISLFNNKEINQKLSLSLPKIRPLVMKNNKDIKDDDIEAWLKDIPYDTRQLSIKNALSSLKSSFELLKNKKIKYFKHKFKSKKDRNQTFYVDHRALKNLNLFPTLLKEHSKLRVNKKYKKYENYIPDSDAIILKKGKKYFILFSKEKKFEKIEKKNDIISLDPGIKRFQSFYTPDGHVGELGNNKLKKKVLKIEKKIDKLKSLISIKKIKKCKSENKCYKLKTKVTNIISDFHWKISSFLAKNYKVVLLPIFKSKDLKKNLSPTNRRLIDIYSHYKFQQKLVYQGKKYGCKVIIVDEHYTTKTCGNCGNLNHFVGNSSVYWCPRCRIELDRDYQAARNILLKNSQGVINPLIDL